jgi:hypothetical protein
MSRSKNSRRREHIFIVQDAATPNDRLASNSSARYGLPVCSGQFTRARENAIKTEENTRHAPKGGGANGWLLILPISSHNRQHRFGDLGGIRVAA